MNREKMIAEVVDEMERSYAWDGSNMIPFSTIAVDYMLEKFTPLLEAVDDFLTVMNPEDVWPGEVDTLRDRYNDLKKMEE